MNVGQENPHDRLGMKTLWIKLSQGRGGHEGQRLQTLCVATVANRLKEVAKQKIGNLGNAPPVLELGIPTVYTEHVD